MDVAQGLEGIVRNASIHAAAVVITVDGLDLQRIPVAEWRERKAQGAGFLLVPGGPDAEPGSAPGEHVERRQRDLRLAVPIEPRELVRRPRIDAGERQWRGYSKHGALRRPRRPGARHRTAHPPPPAAARTPALKSSLAS